MNVTEPTIEFPHTRESLRSLGAWLWALTAGAALVGGLAFWGIHKVTTRQWIATDLLPHSRITFDYEGTDPEKIASYFVDSIYCTWGKNTEDLSEIEAVWGLAKDKWLPIDDWKPLRPRFRQAHRLGTWSPEETRHNVTPGPDLPPVEISGDRIATVWALPSPTESQHLRSVLEAEPCVRNFLTETYRSIDIEGVYQPAGLGYRFKITQIILLK